MIEFKQTIRPGQSGRDVKATKFGMIAMGHKNLKKNKLAGPEWEQAIKEIQKNHHLKPDGIYGRATHKVIAPHFNLYAKWLYRTAKKRKTAPVMPKSGMAAAKKLLDFHASGQYKDDRGTELIQIERAAQGNAVLGPLGYVHLDAHMLEVLVWLIEVKKFKIGTFAMCSDHPYDGPHGHAGGHAVDISSIDGVSVTDAHAKPKVIELLEALHDTPEYLKPWQLISGGYANHRDSQCSAFSIPAADSFYGPTVMGEHCNHVHVGYR